MVKSLLEREHTDSTLQRFSSRSDDGSRLTQVWPCDGSPGGDPASPVCAPRTALPSGMQQHGEIGGE